jgi:cell wall-associated NlpC family hydrolase
MTIVQEPGTPTLAYLPVPTVRRRRVILGLTALVAVTAVTAIGTASPGAWASFIAAVALTGAYAALLHRSRRLQMERELHALLAPPVDGADVSGSYLLDLADLADLAVGPEASLDERVVALDAVPAWRQALALARFAASYAAGWALAPIVFALTVALGRTPQDTTGQRWLANLEATQLRLKEQSMRTLVVSAAATASVTGVATTAVAGGTAMAATRPVTAASISLPAAAGTALTAAVHSSSYTVAAGDTLSSIAARFGTTYQAVAAANHIANPNLIYPGQVLAIGGAATPMASPSVPAEGHSSGGTYTVVAGDTLSSIAARFGTTYQALAQINGIANPNVIRVGEVLRLSGAASQGISSPPPPASTSRLPAPSTPAASSRARIAVQTALAQVGKPYVWGGAGPSSFDCSGLVTYAWAAAGARLAHYTVSQYQETTRISQSQLQPGDLVFYNTGSGAQPGHVTIYIGGGRIVTADSPGTAVRVESLGWDGIPMGFGRVG